VKTAAWLLLTLVVACTARNPAYRDDELVRPGADAEMPGPPPDAAPPLLPDAATPEPDAPPPDAAPPSPDAAPEDTAPPADAAPADAAPTLNPDLAPLDLAADMAPPPPDLAPPDLAADLAHDAGPSTGLTGFYFKDNTLTTLAFQRVDPLIDFSWGNDPPDPSIPFLGFSVRWTGNIHTLYAEMYTFSVHSGDGCRLWIDGSLLIDNWKNQAPTDVYAMPVALTSGWHAIKLEYLHNTGWSAVRILWESPSQKPGVVPSEFLLPN
jgi:PA14 domain